MCKGILSAHSLSKIKTQINKNCCLPMKRQRQRETKREGNKERMLKTTAEKKLQPQALHTLQRFSLSLANIN